MTMISEKKQGEALHAGTDNVPQFELTDDDILDAMRHIPGYLDISTEDFRAIYYLAHAHAVDRLFRRVRAASLMLADIRPLAPDTPLDEAAKQLVAQGRKSLPVVDDTGRVIGMLTETDFLRRLRVDSFLALLLRLVADRSLFTHRCHATPVSEAMSAPPITIPESAGFRAIVDAFRSHDGRSMPVVDADGRLKGLLLRKDFIKAHHLENLL
jgi:CBS-domain-containing membrane protein